MGFARKLLCLTAGFLASVGVANAQRLANPTAPVAGFNPETLVPVLQEMGAQTELLNAGGQTLVGVRMPSGTAFLMGPTACLQTDGRCRGVSIQAPFSRGNATPASVNRFNQQGTIPKVVLLGENAVLYHYIIADHGIPRGNFDSHIGVLENAIMRYRAFRNGGALGQSVSLGHEVSHVGTTPSTVAQHPSGFVAQYTVGTPEAYFND